MHCMFCVSTGDIFIVCLKKEALFLKIKSGCDSVSVPVVTRIEIAVIPKSEVGNETDEAIRSWEGVYQSVTAFFEARKCRSMPMPAVRVARSTATLHTN